MNTKVFINIATKDLERSKAFYQWIGFTLNQQFTDDKAAAIIISDSIYVMVLKEEFMKWFLDHKTLVDSTTSSETIHALEANSKEEVDTFMAKVLTAQWTEFRQAYDYGFMYGRAFQDPDGHIWEVFWMDPQHVQAK